MIAVSYKLWVQSGDMYGSAGEGFIRINIGTHRETLMKGLNRLKDVFCD